MICAILSIFLFGSLVWEYYMYIEGLKNDIKTYFIGITILIWYKNL